MSVSGGSNQVEYIPSRDEYRSDCISGNEYWTSAAFPVEPLVSRLHSAPRPRNDGRNYCTGMGSSQARLTCAVSKDLEFALLYGGSTTFPMFHYVLKSYFIIKSLP